MGMYSTPISEVGDQTLQLAYIEMCWLDTHAAKSSISSRYTDVICKFVKGDKAEFGHTVMNVFRQV